VPEEVKQRRLKEMIDTFVEGQAGLNRAEVGRLHLLLLEGRAKREQNTLMGKTDHFKNGYVGVERVPVYRSGKVVGERELAIGDYLVVRVRDCGPRALYCQPIAIADTLG
jgi:tRNA A37 methylthiotransferase MiaB